MMCGSVLYETDNKSLSPNPTSVRPIAGQAVAMVSNSQVRKSIEIERFSPSRKLPKRVLRRCSIPPPGQIFDFTWSAHGTQLFLTRGSISSGVNLLHGLR